MSQKQKFLHVKVQYHIKREGAINSIYLIWRKCTYFVSAPPSTTHPIRLSPIPTILIRISPTILIRPILTILTISIHRWILRVAPIVEVFKSSRRSNFSVLAVLARVRVLASLLEHLHSAHHQMKLDPSPSPSPPAASSSGSSGRPPRSSSPATLFSF